MKLRPSGGKKLRSCALAAASWLCLGMFAAAQPDFLESEDGLLSSAALAEGRFIAVRLIAEKRLNRDPQDLLGTTLMAQVLSHEGAAPRAYLFSGQSLDKLAQQFPNPKTLPEKVDMLREQMMEIRFSSASEMGLYEEALKQVAEHDKYYSYKWEVRAGWPLLKLGRFDEGQKRMQKLVDGGDPYDGITALNTLGAMHWDRGDVQKARDSFARIKELCIETGVGVDPTILSNKAESEVALGNFDIAERDYLEAGQAFMPESASNPFQPLSMIYIDKAQFNQALNAVRKMNAWSNLSTVSVRNHNWATIRKQLASFLLATGHSEQARPVLEELLYRPERNSDTTDKPYRLECEVLFLYQDCLDLCMARVAEQQSWSSYSESLSLWFASLGDGWDYSDAQQRMAALIVDNDALASALVPYQANWVGPPWLLPDLVEAMGPGVIAAQSEILENKPGAYSKSYLSAYLGEARLRQGRYAEAVPYLVAAEQAMPEQQTLLRARVRLCLAVCRERLGETDDAIKLYQQVLAVDPNAFRRLGFDLPVKFVLEGAPEGEEIASMLDSSPRFRDAGYGFIVELSSDGDGVKARLLEPDGSLLFWVSATAIDGERDLASETCKRFHETVFANPIEITQADVAGLQKLGPDELGL